MSKCDLVVECEQDSYRPGEIIRGAVHVTVNAECTCNGLPLKLVWRTHGRGNRNNGIVTTQDLYQGTWFPGDTHSYPFELEAPHGPYTYRGHNLNVDWYLEASADIPWAFDPTASKDILLEPGDTPPETPPGECGPVPELSEATAGAAIGAIIAGVVLVTGIGMVAAGLLIDSADLWPLSIFGGFACVFGLLVGFIAIRNSLAQRKLGPVSFAVAPLDLRRGDSVSATLHFSPQADVMLNSIKLRLRADEVVVSGSGTKKKTYTHTVFDQEQILLEHEHKFPGDEVALEGSFEIPFDAPLSFFATSNKLRWKVSAAIDIPRWPDWSTWNALRVRP